MTDFKVLNCDVFAGLKQIESNSIDVVVTSPPYWGLRDYGVEGQIGLEEHPQLYIEKIVSVFEEVKRVLKPTGSLWLNLGDSYCAIGSDRGFGKWLVESSIPNESKENQGRGKVQSKDKSGWLQPKQRLLIPHRIAIGMQEKGWILRNDVVWHKPSHMPSSVQDRCTNSFEYVFHFVKQTKYYYDLDSIREPHSSQPTPRYSSNKMFGNTTANREGRVVEYNPSGKNPSDFWSINPKPYKEAHFACFPPALVERCLKATAPKGGIVLDPFVGSGTTLFVAQEMGLNGIGIEINPKYVSLIKKRLLGDEKQVSLNPKKIIVESKEKK